MSGTSDLLFGDRIQKLNNALKIFGKEPEDLKQHLSLLKDWFKNERHLPEIPNDNLITNILIVNKFNIEKCKVNIEMYYTMRPKIPEIFLNKNPKLPHMKIAAKTISYVTMPRLTEEGYRVTFVRLMSNNAEDYFPYDAAAHGYNMVEMRFLKDIMIGDIYVVDMSKYTFAHLRKLTPVHLKKLFSVTEKVFKNLLKQLHFINVPPYVVGLIYLIKQVVKVKLAKRIFAHKSGDGLKDYLSTDVLPKEYGGNEYSLDELNDLWLKELEKHQYRFDELEKLNSDENTKPAPLKIDDSLGVQKNFRELNLD